MISMTMKKNFRRLEKYLDRDFTGTTRKTLNKYGEKGVEALKAVTPVRTGLTRDSWEYQVTQKDGKLRLIWRNTNLTNEGVPVVVLLEYGHGTSNGRFVPARPFVRATLKPIIERISHVVLKNVTRKEKDTGVTEESEVDET